MTLKVLHLIDSGGLYGAEKMLLTLVEEQFKQGLQPMILSAGAPGIGEKAIEAEARRLGLPVTPWRMKPGLNFKETKRILSWAKGSDYDLLHSHGYKFNILMGIWPKSMRGMPVVTTLHGYVHAPKFSKMWLYELLDLIVLSNMAAVIFVNEGMESELKASWFRSSQLAVIPNGINVENIRQRADEEIENPVKVFLEKHSTIVLGVGRLSEEKAFDRLIQAFALLTKTQADAGLIIVGEGRQRGNLESLIKLHQLEDRVLMPGFSDNVPGIMKRSTVLTMPSKTEGLPITILEAMAVGVPVVASRVGALPQLLEEGRGGWMVTDTVPCKLYEALSDSINDSQKRLEKVKWSSNKVLEEYSSSRMASRYWDVYRRLAS